MTNRFTTLLAGLGLAFMIVAVLPGVSSAQDAPTGNVDVPDGQQASGDDTSGEDQPTKASAEKRLEFALSAYHAFPTRAELDEIADADTITGLLRKFATSPDLRPSLRTRAVDALGLYDDEQTRAFLATLVERPESSGANARIADLMRHHAITSLARAHGDASLDTLAPLLDADDLQIRLTTVVALGKHGGEKARTQLEKLRERVDERMLRREIDKYVGDSK
jgi:HEAT repeat protein